MHPSGVQFGLSRGLRQLRGEEILLSDQLVETISLQAQMYLQLGRPAIRGNFLVDITVRAASRNGRDWRIESRDGSSPIPISGMNSPPKPWI